MVAIPILKLVAKAETDLVVARYRMRQIADLAGVSKLERTRLVTALSEVLRNAITFAGEARIEFNIQQSGHKQSVEVIVSDHGPGLPPEALDRHGKCSGLKAAKKLVDEFQIETGPEGTTVKLSKSVGQTLRLVTVSMVEEWIVTLKKNSPFSIVEDLEQQNKQLVDTLLELQKLKSKLEERTEQLNQANKYKGEFLANMSHEIRTPMNAIIGLSNILDRTELSAEQKRLLHLVKNAGGSLLDIINDILDFSKIEAGKLSIESIRFDLFDLIETCVEVLSTNAHGKGLSLVAWIDPDIPHDVMGDSTRMRQIMMNLLSNAIKFTEKGEIIARVKVVHQEHNELLLRFEVIDNGIGLSPEKQRMLFQPFVQADGSTTRKYGGTGLGLSICKQLVDLMKGKIGVDSVEGAGSTFWFELPLLVAQGQSGAMDKPIGFKSALIVDDHHAMREMTAKLLDSWSIKNLAAEHGQAALSLLEKNDFDLVILDYVMPGMNGIDLCAAMRKLDKMRSTRIVLLTALHDEDGLGERAIAAGCNAFLTKPVRQQQLYDCLASLFETGTFLALPSAKVITPASPPSIIAEKIEPKDLAKAAEKGPSNRQVLVVEDNSTNQIVIGIELENLGCTVTMANNGAEALEIMRKREFGIVFMDCQMPVMNGYEATRAIRTSLCKKGRHVPIIAMTANAMEGDREKCIAAGMDDYITKPFQTEELVAAINRWLLVDTAHGAPPGKEKAAKACSVSIDFEKFKAKFNEAQAKQLLTVFVADTEKKLPGLTSFIDGKDFDSVAKLAHSIKGAASMIFAEGLAQAARELEAAGKAEDHENLGVLAEELNRKFEEMSSSARAYLYADSKAE